MGSSAALRYPPNHPLGRSLTLKQLNKLRTKKVKPFVRSCAVMEPGPSSPLSMGPSHWCNPDAEQTPYAPLHSTHTPHHAHRTSHTHHTYTHTHERRGKGWEEIFISCFKKNTKSSVEGKASSPRAPRFLFRFARSTPSGFRPLMEHTARRPRTPATHLRAPPPPPRTWRQLPRGANRVGARAHDRAAPRPGRPPPQDRDPAPTPVREGLAAPPGRAPPAWPCAPPLRGWGGVAARKSRGQGAGRRAGRGRDRARRKRQQRALLPAVPRSPLLCRELPSSRFAQVSVLGLLPLITSLGRDLYVKRVRSPPKNLKVSWPLRVPRELDPRLRAPVFC